ncbi:MAG: response regulator [Nitrospirota bacterium]
MSSILIVDDEPLILYGLAKVLRVSCSEVTTAGGAKSALREIDTHRFDLCLIDIHLPDGSGIDIARRIRESSPTTKVIIMSGREPDDQARAFIDRHSLAVLTKPFDLAPVKALVLQALAAAGPATEKRRSRRTPFLAGDDCAISVIDPLVSPQWTSVQADIIDISDGGIGMAASRRLDCGCILRLSGIGHAAGVVRWVICHDTGSACRYGVQFI